MAKKTTRNQKQAEQAARKRRHIRIIAGIIMVAAAAGLAFGMGYLAYGIVFLLVAGGLLMAFSATKIWESKPTPKEKKLVITIPEGLDYTAVFDDLMSEYTEKSELVKVKSVNMGSMFRLTYLVTLKDAAKEKAFLDDLRCRNGNLEVRCGQPHTPVEQL